MTSSSPLLSADPLAAEGVPEVAGAPYTPLETGAAILLGVIALLVSGLMPLLLGALAEEHRLSAAGIGRAAMLEALSTGLVTGIAGIVLKPRRLRIVAAAASAALVAVDLATVHASGGGVLLVRALAGLPEGLMLWIAIGLISRTETPERWAAMLFTGMGVSQLLVATALSTLVLPRHGASGGYAVLAAAVALAIPLSLWLPRALGEVPGAQGHAAGAPPLRGWIALAGTLAFAAALSAAGVYVLPLAREVGLSVAVARTAISVSLACQIFGGLLAAALAGRVGYLLVFWASGLVFLATWATYAAGAPAAAFVALTGLAGLCGMLASPFLVPMTIEADPSRRAAMQSGAVQLLAGALGPLLASFVVGERDARGVLALSAALLLVGLAIVTVLHRLARAERLAAATQAGL